MFKYSSSLLLIVLLIVISGCSKKSDTELWDEALNYQKSSKYGEALSAYKQLADEHPDSKLAIKALFESAKIYQSGLDKSISPQVSLKYAAENYKKITDQYPKTEEAPKCLFMLAFIQANELKDLTAAKANYEKFLKEYPNHEMAPSARAEIDNMGVPPDQFINKNLQAKK